MRMRITGMLALAALAASCTAQDDGTDDAQGAAPAASPAEASAAGATLAKGIYELPACAGDTSNPLGTINIVLPDKFDGGPIGRKVNSGPKVAKNDPKTGEGNGNGGGNGGFNPNKPGSAQPFDVFLQGGDYSGQTGYLMVRVLLTKPAKFAFWEQDGIHGIGSNDPSNDLICGASAPVAGNGAGNGQAEWISIFYVDVAALAGMSVDAALPFTIGLTADNTGANAARTPILIDPKIINDGGGVRLTNGGNG